MVNLPQQNCLKLLHTEWRHENYRSTNDFVMYEIRAKYLLSYTFIGLRWWFRPVNWRCRWTDVTSSLFEFFVYFLRPVNTSYHVHRWPKRSSSSHRWGTPSSRCALVDNALVELRPVVQRVKPHPRWQRLRRRRWSVWLVDCWAHSLPPSHAVVHLVHREETNWLEKWYHPRHTIFIQCLSSSVRLINALVVMCHRCGTPLSRYAIVSNAFVGCTLV